MRRTERLFAIAEYLRGRRTGITAEALATRFEVTVRTMYRDLDSLRDASLPLHAERGRGGGFALDRNYALPPVNFTAREAALLVVAGHWITEFRLLPFTDTLRSAIEKVRAALPAQTQRELQRVMQSLSFVGVPAQSARPDVRRVIEQAWFERRTLRIEYDGAQGLSRRRIEIQSVVMERTETLLNALDLEKGESRQFKLHRVVSAAIDDAPK